MSHETIVTTWTTTPDPIADDADQQPRFGLVVAWCPEAPHRVGEVALLPTAQGGALLGRGGPLADDPLPRLTFARQRPGRTEVQPPLAPARVSRRQCHLTPSPDGLVVRQTGRCPMRISGQPTTEGLLRPGDTLYLEKALLLVCVERPMVLPPLRSLEAGYLPPFGHPDPWGMVGESPATWRLRDQLAFYARREAHVLIHGPSGAGKELAAQAIHALSPRRDHALVARNAATIPATLIDAELFGNLKDYPNPGMRARPGLIGEADGGTLFLDEIGELSPDLQAHLLRVLDAHGEYQRLGESRPRRADLRLVAATQRAPDQLKHDLLARLTLRVTLEGLDQRVEDIPLILAHQLRGIARDDAEIGARFFAGWGETGGTPRVAAELVDALIRHTWRLHVRELQALLWQAMGESQGGLIELTSGVSHALLSSAGSGRINLTAGGPPVGMTGTGQPTTHRDPASLTVEQITEALVACGGVQSRAWKRLGLRSRDQLYRLIKKHQIDVSSLLP